MRFAIMFLFLFLVSGSLTAYTVDTPGFLYVVDKSTSHEFSKHVFYVNVTNKLASAQSVPMTLLFGNTTIDLAAKDIPYELVELGGSRRDAGLNRRTRTEKEAVFGNELFTPGETKRFMLSFTTPIEALPEGGHGSRGSWELDLGGNVLDPWWDTTVPYRIPVYLNQSMLRKQLNVTLGTSNFTFTHVATTNGVDVCVTNSSDDLQSAVWFTNATQGYLNGSTSTLWVNVTENSTTNNTLFLYYGNSSVTCEQNGTKVFPIFENWTSGALTTYGVQLGTSSNVKFGTRNGVSVVNLTTDTNTGDIIIRSTANGSYGATAGNVTLPRQIFYSYILQYGSNGSSTYYEGFGYTGTSLTNEQRLAWVNGTGYVSYWHNAAKGTQGSSTDLASFGGFAHTANLLMNGSNWILQVNGTQKANWSDVNTTAGQTLKVGFGRENGGKIEFGPLFVTEYYPTSFTLGAEEDQADINLYLWDEDTSASLSGNMTAVLTWNSSTDQTTSSGTNTHNITVFLSNASWGSPLNLSVMASYLSYPIRVNSYAFDNSSSANGTSINVYVSSDAKTTQIIAQTTLGIRIPNTYVTIERLYANGTYLQIGNVLLDISGSTATFALVDNTVFYRFNFTYQGSAYTSTQAVICGTADAYCVVYLTIPQNVKSYYEQTMNSTSYTCALNTTTNVTFCDYTDTSGISATYKLRTWLVGLKNSTLLCTNTSTSASGTLSCYLGDTNGSVYESQFAATHNPTNPIYQWVNDLRNMTQPYGNEAIFAGWIVVWVVGAGALAAASPSAAIIMVVIGIITTAVLQLMVIPVNALAGIAVVGIVLAYLMRS